MKKKQVNLKRKLILDKNVIASLVQQPEKIIGGVAVVSRPNTLCITINYTVCITVCNNQICS